MMSSLSHALLLLPALLTNGTPHLDRPGDDRIHSMFARWDLADSPGAAVAVIKDGEIVVADGYGSAQLEYEVPVTPESVFHVASISKQVTAFAVCLLAADGKLSLDDDVRNHLREVPDFGHEITLKDLLHHTSGLRDQWEALAIAGWRLDDVITTEHVLTMVANQRELNFRPREEHLYCNTGYTLLGEVVARVSGQSFPEFCRKRIFRPLGMTSTRFHDDHEEVVRDRTYSYSSSATGFRNAVLSFANAGATSMFTTAIDLVLWLENMGSATVGGAEVQEMMRECYVLNDGTRGAYALGVVLGDYKGHATVSHGGSDAGFRAFAVWFPDQNLGVAVLANLAEIQATPLAYAVADLFLTDPPPAKEPALSAPETSAAPSAESTGEANDETPSLPPPLSDYVGRYWSEELGTFYDVRAEGEQLVARHRRHGAIRLIPADGTDAFQGNRWFFGRTEFQRGEEGEIDAFRLQGGRARNVLFERK